MASAGGDAAGGRPAEAAADGPKLDRSKPDRRAEALRANLRRRKAQARARDEADQDGTPAAPVQDALGGEA